jgi:hypothetical protein
MAVDFVRKSELQDTSNAELVDLTIFIFTAVRSIML